MKILPWNYQPLLQGYVLWGLQDTLEYLTDCRKKFLFLLQIFLFIIPFFVLHTTNLYFFYSTQVLAQQAKIQSESLFFTKCSHSFMTDAKYWTQYFCYFIGKGKSKIRGPPDKKDFWRAFFWKEDLEAR